MARIFLALASFAVVLLVANLLVGVTMGDFGQSSRQFQAAFRHYDELTQSRTTRAALDEAEQMRTLAAKQLHGQRLKFWPHIWLGITAALITLLVNSISVTYFIGTHRWSREVVDAFSLDRQLAERSRLLKRRAFPWALLAIVLILVISALGAAADPATLNPNAADWVVSHWTLAMLGVVIIAACLLAQVSAISQNFALINEILAAAEQERERRRVARELATQK